MYELMKCILIIIVTIILTLPAPPTHTYKVHSHRQDLSSNMKLIDLARMASQQGSGVHLSLPCLPPPGAGVIGVTVMVEFLGGFWGSKLM